MGYKPQVVTKSIFGGPKGGAKVVWNKDHSKLQVTLGDDKYTFSKADLEDLPKSFPSGEYYVQLSEDKTRLLNIRPNNGMFVVKVDRFAAKEGETPAPKIISATDPTSKAEYSYQIFSVILKIVSPKEYADMEIFFSPRYNFEGVEDEINGKKVEVVAYNHPKSKYTPLLQDFCEATGVWEKGPMKWATNILPALAKRIAQADRKFQVVVKEGWVNTIFVMPDVSDEDEVKEEETNDLPDETESENKTTPDVLNTDEDDLEWSGEE